jgi:hypothetical protein
MVLLSVFCLIGGGGGALPRGDGGYDIVDGKSKKKTIEKGDGKLISH